MNGTTEEEKEATKKSMMEQSTVEEMDRIRMSSEYCKNYCCCFNLLRHVLFTNLNVHTRFLQMNLVNRQKHTTLELGTSKKELSVRNLVNVLRSTYGIPYFCVAYYSYNLITLQFYQIRNDDYDGFKAYRMYPSLHLIITSNI